MNGNMLDTNVIIKYLAGDTYTKRLIDSTPNIAISAIVVGELHYGAQKSTRVESNMLFFQAFLSRYEIIPIDEPISTMYGIVKNQLRKSGINIPENDVWIAATAKSCQYNLLTYDAHFKAITGLNIVS